MWKSPAEIIKIHTSWICIEMFSLKVTISFIYIEPDEFVSTMCILSAFMLIYALGV